MNSTLALSIKVAKDEIDASMKCLKIYSNKLGSIEYALESMEISHDERIQLEKTKTSYQEELRKIKGKLFEDIQWISELYTKEGGQGEYGI